MAGVGYAYMLLQNIPTSIVGGTKAIERETHSFLKTRIKGKEILFDPINNFIFPLEEAEQRIKEKGKPTKYHFPNKEFSMKFEY